ncbi:MAG: transcriptional regulator, AraC family [Herbinix sp.]|jgi:AraC family transcriptional regulator|nr:transcriptional regulator, AraC family [Herbinix sp.]
MKPIKSIFDSIVYINKNISNEITLEQCSKIAHMPVSYYIEKFKQTIGLTPHKYIMKRRLELSTQSLLEQNLIIGFCWHLLEIML